MNQHTLRRSERLTATAESKTLQNRQSTAKVTLGFSSKAFWLHSPPYLSSHKLGAASDLSWLGHLEPDIIPSEDFALPTAHPACCAG